MKLAVFLRFSTKPGQKIKIKGNIPSLGLNSPFATPLQYYSTDLWSLIIDIHDNELVEKRELAYTYVFEDEWGNVMEDWGINRLLKLDKHLKQLTLIDTWIDMGAIENVYYTAPFKNRINCHKPQKKNLLSKTKLNIRIKAPILNAEDQLALTGNRDSLGNWLSDGYVPLDFDGESWVGKIDLPFDLKGIEYKYVILDKEGKLKSYESGENRKLVLPGKLEYPILIQDGFFRSSHEWKGTGLAIPVFSLRSTKSLGVGEFNDISLLVDWASSVSIKMIQLLPVNDTTSTYTYLDSYPYAAISAFALHPLYGSIEEIAGEDHRGLIQDVIVQKSHLNSFNGVDYEAVMNLKWKAYRALYAEMKKSVFKSKEYKLFYEENQQWLKPYAVFCYLRDLNGTTDFSVWNAAHQFSSDLVEGLTNPKGKVFDQVGLHLFVQYFLHVQLKRAHEYANQHGIVLKGDIAIGVNKQSADTWVQPELYNLDQQAGAPPDDFAIKGQNWGFPTYNWKVMKQRNFDWWKLRFMQMSNYFDAFRIDHILGFFRIWSIPSHAVEGIMGKFVPAIPVHSDELRNIIKDISLDRLCNPYINDVVLNELSQGRPELLHPFLYSTGHGMYAFKPEFSTQRLIEKHMELGGCAKQQFILQALYNLHSNVILWRDEQDRNGFHFRFHAFKTLSFQFLEAHVQTALMQLYNDYFFHRQENIWKKEALDKLPDLKKCTEMLICGEDLGLVPSCVPEVMNSLGFLSMEVQRMPKQSNQSFFDPKYAPYLSVVTPSTHDMSTLREWWTENHASSQHFYNEQLGQHGQAPHDATPSVIRGIIQQHLHSPAMWAVFQLQDLLAISERLRLANPAEERINIPGDSKHYWRYRMPIHLEDLMREEEFNMDLRSNINSSNR